MESSKFIDWLRNAEADKAELLKLEIAVKIDQALTKSGMTRTAFAKKIGTSPAWVTKVLRGDVNLTIETMCKLSHALDLDLAINFSRKSKSLTSAVVYQFAEFKPEYSGARECYFPDPLRSVTFNTNDYEFGNAA